MYNSKTEVLFPGRYIPDLGDLRGPEWQALVNRVAELPARHPERLGFLLFMVKLGGCTSCHADAYWAMQGCARCARNTITRFRGEDEDLLEKYQQALQDMRVYLAREVENEKSI